MVDLGTDTMCADYCMDQECKIQRRTSRGHGLELALGGDNENLGTVEIQLYSGEEIHCRGLWIVEDFLDGK